MKYKFFIISILLSLTLQYQSNYLGLQTSITLGENEEKLDIILDTTIGTSYIHMSNTSNTNKPTGSTNITNEEVTISNTLSGNLTYDTITIGESTIPFTFVAVENEVPAVLGLGYNYKHNGNNSIINSLYNAGVIDKRMFALGGNVFQLGSNKLNITSFCNLTSNDGLKQEYKEGWLCDIDYLTTGSNDVKEGYEVDGRVIFDSTYQYIAMPSKYMIYVKKYLFDNFGNESLCQNIFDNKNKTSFICVKQDTINFTNIYFVIDGYGYSIPGNKLFKQSSENSTHLHLLIDFVDDDIFILGKIFFDEYTLVFDYDNKNVGFIGNVTDLRENIKDWENDFLNKADRFFYIMVFSTIFGALLFIIIILLIVRAIKRGRMEEHGPLIESV